MAFRKPTIRFVFGTILILKWRTIDGFLNEPPSRPTSSAVVLPKTTTPALLLETWLNQNSAILQSKIGTDCNGLRGLFVEYPHSERNQKRNRQICRIPRNCIIVADPRDTKNKQNDAITALARTLCKELRLGSKSRYYPYIRTLPPPGDISLAGIGGRWNDEQLSWLGHEPTIEYFAKLGAQRQVFVRDVVEDMHVSSSSSSMESEAGWAYDLVSSRALTGPFGKRGTVRSAVLTTLAAFIWAATVPSLAIITHNNLMTNGSMDVHTTTTILLLATVLPLPISATRLVSALLDRSEQSEIAMLPWIDIANHKSKSKMYLEYGLWSDEIIMKHDAKTSRTDSSPTVNESGENPSFPLGMPVNFDYGGASKGIGNDKLLGIYGFVEENNPNDTLKLRVGKHISTTITIGRKGRLLTKDHHFTLHEVSLAVEELREKLLDLNDSDRHNHFPQKSDSIVLQRHRLAAQWRKEKIRLLDEFLVVHLPTFETKRLREERLREETISSL